MTAKNTLSNQLLPHQQALIEQFLNETGVRGFAVRWEAGLGLGSTIAHLVKSFIAAAPATRVLVLIRKVLISQTQHQFASTGLQADLVDRFRFRAMEDAVSTPESIWHEGGVFILEPEFAAQGDVAASLCSVEWGLLIVLEAQELQDRTEDLVKRLVDGSPALRVLLMAHPTVKFLPDFGIGSWMESTIRLSDVVDAAGRRLFDFENPVLTFIEVKPDRSEDALRDCVAELVQLMDSAKGSERIFGDVIANALRSSIPALEGVLRRIRNRIAHGMLTPFQGNESFDGNTDPDNIDLPLPAEFVSMLGIVSKCLEEVERISIDSKLERLVTFLEEIHERGVFPRSTCIITRYQSTLAYVNTALDENHFITFSIHGSMDFGERLEELDECRENDGILLTTEAALEGLSMPEVKTLIFYDIPNSAEAMERILGRFQRFGRVAPLTVYLFGDQAGAEAFREVLHTVPTSGDRDRN